MPRAVARTVPATIAGLAGIVRQRLEPGADRGDRRPEIMADRRKQRLAKRLAPAIARQPLGQRRLRADARRKLAHHQRHREQHQHRHEIVGIGDVQRIARRHEEEVERERARAAADPLTTPNPRPITVETIPGQPGETCLRLTDRTTKPPLTFERCTWALAWPRSARFSPHNNAVAVPIQPLSGWVELWVFRRLPKGGKVPPGWTVDILAPATRDPDLGYVELAGFSPDGTKVLVTREARTEAGTEKRFQVLHTDTLTVEKETRTSPDPLLAFRKWASPEWRGRTIALR